MRTEPPWTASWWLMESELGAVVSEALYQEHEARSPLAEWPGRLSPTQTQPSCLSHVEAVNMAQSSPLAASCLAGALFTSSKVELESSLSPPLCIHLSLRSLSMG